MFHLVEHLDRQRAFSLKTFGPGPRVQGVIDHIKKELVEVSRSGGALDEWVDVVILALDGAWRSGATSPQIVDALLAKQIKNEMRQWPDWRTAAPDQAIEHQRGVEGEPAKGCPQPSSPLSDRNAAIRTLVDQLIEGLANETAIALLLRTALVCEQTGRELRVKLLKEEEARNPPRTFTPRLSDEA